MVLTTRSRRSRSLGALCALLVWAAHTCLPAHAAAATGNPFATARLFVDPNSAAWRQVSAWQDSRPADAAQIAKIARQPQAEWLGGWLPDVRTYARWWINSKLRPSGATAFFVVYNLPQRDCSGHYSAGGAGEAAAYRRWVDAVAQGIGDYPAIVVVEPDGVPDTNCLGPAARRTRLGLISYATRTLASLPHTSVYIDAGRSNWRSVKDTVPLLRAAGVAQARGFALDVTGYATTRAELRYGHAIGRALGGKHFVISTSRNGLGPMPRSWVRKWEDLWCNQWGRALGPRPTTRTGDRLADAYEWILHPGNSDGPCNGGGPAGEWWPSYALGLARRAGY